ncbi:tRNA (adenosine(37)-N6)-threonylcarbamoyltransferase complex transferase subunit TsaD [Candidatus Daviesbacteria bacterium RIFCSPLOWO2_01_FULL_36_8]|nr:MAG: tRNA (adenosine(37)-N6)-threonylcarbamoyltransferase complex transferase subunit TsaD [Candidatus Daviesbacteria bacterium RIFCSPLOWO2_01_FULL_36_8]
MIILGIETSCDETGAAVLTNNDGRITILSNIVASSANLQSKYGGVIPEQAAREQIKSIIPVIQEALSQAFPNYTLNAKPYTLIDAIAVTYGPGLIGSLLVGVETAKTLAEIWGKPLIPINHLLGHFYANWITTAGPASSASRRASSLETLRLCAGNPSSPSPAESIPAFPCIGLLVSGGHTDLVLFQDHGKYTYLGGTRDDAAGECFDKCARLLGLSYPGGPEISKLAEKGDANSYSLPRPMMDSKDFDFSFSGLKTAVSNVITDKVNKFDLSASIEAAIVDVLVDKTIRAARKHNVEQIMIAGGVAANKSLVNRLQVTVDNLGIKLHVPPPNLCTDNGAMIAAAGFFSKPSQSTFKVEADPNLSLSQPLDVE